MKMLVRLALMILWLSPQLAPALSAEAGRWDYSYSLGLRSQPAGLAVWGELGYNHLLWGDSPSIDNPFYGYVRPKVTLQSSGIVNRADVGVDLALWAPLVLEFTYGWDHRGGDFNEFNCVALQCRELLTRSKAAVNVTLGYANYFLLSDSLVEIVKGPQSPQKNFGDESWSLAGRYPKDTLLSSKLTLGRKLTERWSVGVQGAKAKFRDSGENYTSALAFVSVRQSGFRYFLGAGLYESSRTERGFATAFGLKWVGGDSFSLR